MRGIIFFLCMSVPTMSGADSALMSFDSDGKDASLSFLSTMFGVVDGVLHGTGSQLPGHLSNQLSTILLFCAAILWTYTAFVSILNTASDGQFLGQKWSSMWVPIRVVAGICLLMPKGTTGYSLIQVIVMSVVVQGVNAANLALKTTLNYLENGGVIVESVRFLPKQIDQDNSRKESDDVRWAQDYLLKTAGKVLISEVSMMTLYYLFDQQSRQHGVMPPPHFGHTLNLQGYKGLNDTRREIRFPEVWRPGFCGAINWTPSDPQGGMGSQSDLMTAAIQLMVLNLLPTAERIAMKIIPPTSAQIKASDHQQTPQSMRAPMLQPNLSASVDSKTPISFTQGEDFTLVKAVQSVMGMLKVEFRNSAELKKALSKQNFEKTKADIEAAGWIMAGSYYWFLAQTNHAISQLSPRWSDIGGRIGVTEAKTEKVRNQLPEAKSRENFKRCLEELDGEFIKLEQERLESYQQTPWITHPSARRTSQDESEKVDIQAGLDWLSSLFASNSRSFQEWMQSTLDEKQDPIIALSSIGRKLLLSTEDVWQKFNRSKIRFQGLVVEEKSEQGGWRALNHTVEAALGALVKFAALLPILTIWMVLNFTLGSVLVYYLPLIPFLLFFFGSLTWFASVIGGVLAGPLVALSLMDPEGDNFLGQAKQAVKSLAILFLRPMLMVFGLIFGMMLCTVIFELFHYGYRVAMQQIPLLEGKILPGITQIANTTIYTTMAMAIVTRCFALIYELPNRVFGWIGWQTEGHGEAEILGQVKGDIHQQVGGIGSRVTETVTSPAKSHASQESAPNQYDITIQPGS
jgi:defect-in-organelle-trafficking protein DotA